MRATLVHGEAVELDLTELRRRLQHPHPGQPDPAGDPGARAADPALRPASVLVPIVARAEQFTMLFTRRAEQLRNHSGQISFPGGRAEAHDPNPEATALRETREEIGLDERRVEVVARLPEYPTRTGFRITPVVGLVTPPFELTPDALEVDEVFEVPLSFLLDPAHHEWHSLEIRGEMRWFYALTYGRYYIWGATAGMLVNFYRRLASAPAPV